MIGNQKGFAQILILLILLAGIGITVYLAQYTQVFKPKAAEPPINSSALYGSTPKSEINSYPKPANSIQIGFIFGVNQAFSSDELTFLAKEVDYFYFDQSSMARNLDGTGTPKTRYDQSALWQQITALKNAAASAGRTIKIGSHGGMPFGVAPFHIIYDYIGDPTSPTVEPFFLHRNGQPVIYNGHPQIRYYNLSYITRGKLEEGWKRLLTDHPQLDSFMFDTMMYPSKSLFQELTDLCTEGPCGAPLFWAGSIDSMAQNLKTIANSKGKDFFYNGLFEVPNYDSWKAAAPDAYGTNYGLNTGFIEYTDGALAEHFHTIIESPQIFKKYMDGFRYITSRNKKLIIWTQPQTYCVIASQGQSLSCPGNTFKAGGIDYPLDLNTARFYLASYLLIQKNPLTYFGYHPGTFYSLPSFFYADWNKDYGATNGEFAGPADGNGLFLRSYINGLVVVNPTSRTLPLHLPIAGLKEWDPVSGPIAPQDTTVPPKSGKFYFNPRLPSVSASPSISPQKPGDSDGDNDVDIFDYNVVIGDFGKTNDPLTKADLDNDNDVDIFDYNIVVTNFGK